MPGRNGLPWGRSVGGRTARRRALSGAACMSSLSAAKTCPKANRRRWMTAGAAFAVLSPPPPPPRPFAQGPTSYIIRDTEVEEIVHKEGEPMWRAAGLNPDNVKIVIM